MYICISPQVYHMRRPIHMRKHMIKAGQNVITQSLVISERDETPHIFMVSSSSVPIFSMYVLVKPFCNTLFDKYLPVTSLHWC